MLHTTFHKIFRNPVLLAVAIIALGWVIIELRGILVILFISYIIMAALNPSVARLRSWRVPKVIAAAIVYIIATLAIVLVVIPVVPFLIEQIHLLFLQFPFYLDTVTQALGINFSADQLEEVFTSELATIGQNAVDVTARVFGGIFAFLSIIVISFYLLLDHQRIKESVAGLFKKEKREKVEKILTTIEYKLGAWLRGQLVLSFVIGFTTWIALFVIGVPFALPLAVIAGILEIIPTLGPILAAVPAVIIAFNISPTLGLVTIGVYIGIQILENNLIVPKIMQKAVGLNPLIIIIGIIVGSQLLGIAGALLSIPFISLIKVILTSLDDN